MDYLKRYNQFILEEISKNEPIPEIIGVDRGLAVFVIGAPGIGKSYFITNHIHSKTPNIKDFSTDDVSLLYTGDPNIYYKGREKEEGGRTKNASELNLDRMTKFMETGQNFIYDTTGSGKEFTDRGFEHIKEIYEPVRVRIEIGFRPRGGISSKLVVDSDWGHLGGTDKLWQSHETE